MEISTWHLSYLKLAQQGTEGDVGKKKKKKLSINPEVIKSEPQHFIILI